MDTGRQERGTIIANTMKLVKAGEMWLVPSQTGYGRQYAVYLHHGEQRCSCPDHQERGVKCKHMFAVEIVIQRELFPDGTEAVTKSVTVTETVRRPSYPQDWTNYNRAQTQEHRQFQTLLADLCSTLPVPAPKPGRPPISPRDAAFCALLKVYSTMSARRFVGDLQEAKQSGYVSRVPHFNSVLNFFDTESATAIINDFVGMSAAPLATVESDFAVDSTGFSSTRYTQWVEEKYGAPNRKADWVKLHAIIGVKTNVVVAAMISEKHSNDVKYLPALVQAASQRFTIKEVSADAAYLSRKNFAAVESVGATFYPAFKKNTKALRGGSYAKAFHMFCMNQEEYEQHYHKRSNVESTFSAIKRKFGESVKSKTDRAMNNEALAKCVCHNITCLIGAMYELGISPTLGQTPTNPDLLPMVGRA